MKKIFIVLFYSAIIIFNIQAGDECFYRIDEEYILDSIDDRFIGAYLSIGFLNNLEKTKSYDFAMNRLSRDSFYGPYQRILVFKNKIIYSYPWGEGSSGVKKCNFIQYQFIYLNENDILIIDPNGHVYRKMTNDLKNHEIFISNYIAKIILSDLIEQGEIILERNIITIPSLENRKFKVGTLGYIYNNNENLKLRDYDRHNYFSLEIEDNTYTIYWIERNHRTSYKEVKRIVWEKQI